MITLTSEQVKELEAYLLELPAKYANPIFQFLGNIVKEQHPEAEKASTEQA
jgi:hypothetical protein